ncbi:MAG: DegV family protein [Eubacteriales bacterium]|nr:DegV family protein [Eubacteriales bacterium]
MPNYAITCDSTVDLSLTRMQELNVPFAKLSYLFDGVSHPDDMTDDSARYIYQSMLDGKVITTSQPNESAFVAMWEPYLENGQDILHIGFSSALSGSVNSARLAESELRERFPERHILIVDSLCASGGEGMLLQHVLLKRDAGLSLEDNYTWAENNKLRVHHWFTVGSMEYLKRGGRVNPALAFVANILSIKPVMNMDRNGRLIPREKVKGRRASIHRMFEKLEQFIDLEATPFVHITQAECMEDALTLKGLIQDKYPGLPVNISYVGAVIGAHAGPGTLALFFMGNGRE